jgi:tetratricopeptide (TPR) repeat protein
VQTGDLLSGEGVADYEAAEAKYKQSLMLKPNQFGANFGMGSMIYNRAADKTNAANAIDPFASDYDDEKAALYEKLNEEAKAYYGQSIGYLEKAVAYIDGLPEGEFKNAQRPNLINVLVALGTAYAHVDRLNESAAAKARVDQLMK